MTDLTAASAIPHSMLPHFLVIGAQKSGTTWLDRNLRLHPEIWLPPEKEIHYFDLPRIPFVLCALAPNPGDRHWAVQRIKTAYRKARATPALAAWYRRAYLGPRSDRWYASLFSPGPGQLAGEVAPQYGPLDERAVARIHALLPNIKIIYLLRNPIERMWSQVAMYHGERFGGAGVESADVGRLLAFIRKPAHLGHSLYARNLATWERYYGPAQVLVRFHEDIRDRPAELLEHIFRHLGVDCSGKHVTALAGKKIFARVYAAMPDAIASELARLLMAEIETLHARFANAHTAAWLSQAQDLRGAR